MSGLNIQQKTYFEIWESDLSKFISEHYNRPYRMQQQGEMMGQNSYDKIEVHKDGDDWTGCDGFGSPEECRQMIEEWLAVDHTVFDYDFKFMREHYVPVDVLMWDLCQRNVIPPGEYLILVWW